MDKFGKKTPSDIDLKEFVIAWQTSSSKNEVGLKMDMSHLSVTTLATRLRSVGVPLKKFTKQTPQVDIENLKQVAIDAIASLPCNRTPETPPNENAPS